MIKTEEIQDDYQEARIKYESEEAATYQVPVFNKILNKVEMKEYPREEAVWLMMQILHRKLDYIIINLPKKRGGFVPLGGNFK